jgi:hypothetical protein
MRSGFRLIAGGLCSVVLLASVGCVTGVERAAEERQYLYPGMTMDEVSYQLGEPTQVIEGDPGTETAWIYRFEGGPTAVGMIVLVVFFILVIAVLVMAGGGGSINGGGGGGDSPPSQIRLRFGPDHRLIDVSPPHPVPGK